jgi:hypothetical protein
MFTLYYLSLGYGVIIYDRYGLHQSFLQEFIDEGRIDYHSFTIFEKIFPKDFNLLTHTKKNVSSHWFFFSLFICPFLLILPPPSPSLFLPLSSAQRDNRFKYWHFVDAFLNETDSDMSYQIEKMQAHTSSSHFRHSLLPSLPSIPPLEVGDAQSG